MKVVAFFVCNKTIYYKRKIMKNLLLGFVVVLTTILSTAKSCEKPKEPEGKKMYGYEYVYNQRQLDSMCVADTLNPNIESWINTYFIDYETNEKIVKYMYLKEYNEMVYTVTPKDTLFLVNKTEVKSE